MKNGLSNTLNKNNIDEMIEIYKNSLNEMDLSIFGNNIFDLFCKIKRDTVNKGPYPDVTLFEAANRIMTDLVILYGIKKLLDGYNENIKFSEYHVEYGNENNNKYDIIAEENGNKLIGEAFNVAPSFFQGKKSKSLTKLRNRKSLKDTIIILIYNSDAVDINYIPKNRNNEYHILVDIKI